MNIFKDYAYVVNGEKRKQVVQLLHSPRTPTELAKLMHVHANVITRILNDLKKQKIAEQIELSQKGQTYMLTKRGELTRQILNHLIEPKTLPSLAKILKIHRSILSAILKHLIKHGYLTIFKTLRPAKKMYRLTAKGEDIREKL